MSGEDLVGVLPRETPRAAMRALPPGSMEYWPGLSAWRTPPGVFGSGGVDILLPSLLVTEVVVLGLDAVSR